MFRDRKYNRALRDIGLLTGAAIFSIIAGSGIGLLVLFHVLAWENLGTQFMFWESWAALPIVLSLRSMLKKHLS